MKKVKVKIEELSRTEQLQLAKAFYSSCPFSTRVYMAMKTGLSIEFIKTNWEAITGLKDVNNFFLK